jgi:hypothetical protein
MGAIGYQKSKIKNKQSSFVIHGMTRPWRRWRRVKRIMGEE